MKYFLHTLFFFLLVTQICFAQWVQLGLDDKAIKEIAAKNSTIFAITSDSGSVYRSTDNGINWLQIVDSFAVDIAIAPSASLFMIAENSLYKSSDNGNNWVNITEQLPLQWEQYKPINVTISPLGFVFCGLIDINMEGDRLAFAMSTDDGLTWTSPGVTIFGGVLFDFRGQSVITWGYWRSLFHGDTYVYLSSDYGQSWLEVGDPPLIHNNVLSMCLNGNILMGGSYYWQNPGLFLSTDSCNTWTQVSQFIPKAGLSIESGGMLIGTDTLGVFLFSDNGDSLGSFNEVLTNLNTHTLSMDNNGYVYLGTDNGVWRRPLSEIVPVELISFAATTNGKEVILNWTTATELNNQGFEIQRSTEGAEFFTVGFVDGHGTTTEQQNYSYADRNLDDGNYYYRLKQVDYDGSYEYSDVVEVDFRTFNSYLLEQNYPNPFNPTTTIGFGIQNKSNVKITILNSIGEEVTVLLNEEREPGFHQVEFSAKGGSASGGNAYNLPSGVYFYQLKADNYIETKKMVLLR